MVAKILSIVIVTTIVSIYNVESQISSNIPNYLIPCYRNGFKITTPLNVRFLLEIIHKLEKYEPNLSVRLMSYSIVRSFRLDGIERAPGRIQESERVTPYAATAFQFHKYKLLLDSLIPGQNVLNVENILSTYEICAMHKMISSTVNRRERGDEKYVCPLNMNSAVVAVSTGNASTLPFSGNSRCPIEEGAVLSPWGTISPGIIITSLAAAFDSQNVPISDIVSNHRFFEFMRSNDAIYDAFTPDDSNVFSVTQSHEKVMNIWASSISGDLAEVVLRQGPYGRPLTLGPGGRWNDTFLPRHLYLLLEDNNYQWEFTDAEILGGIDALIIANYATMWPSATSPLRLSQILEMYYSSVGLLEDTKIKVCNRNENFGKIYNEATLFNQTLNFGKLLSLTYQTPSLNEQQMSISCQEAVTKFTGYYSRLLQNFGGCKESRNSNHVEIIVATDGTWDRYGVEVLLLSIIEVVDVSSYGSRLGLIQGNTGEWIVRPTHSMAEIYESINNYTSEWPDRLSLPNVLTTLISFMKDKVDEEMVEPSYASLSTVLLVAAPTTRVGTNDLDRSKTIIQTLRQFYHDLYIIHLLPDQPGYKDITIDQHELSDTFLHSDSANFMENVGILRGALSKTIYPKKLIPVTCSTNLSRHQPFDDFVLPGERRVYRIHPYYFRYENVINIKFYGTGSGDLTICTHRNLNGPMLNCTALENENTILFELNQPCEGVFCHPMYFSVTIRRPTKTCTGMCRLPTQTRYRLSHEGLRCYWPLERANSAALILLNLNLRLAIFTITIIKYLI